MSDDRARQMPRLHDDAVDALPLHHGRTELLEEIMTTPVLDDSPVRDQAPRRPSRYLVPLAAAATVAALATIPLWNGAPATVSDPTGFAAGGTSQGAEPAYFPVLDATGWRIEDAAADPDGGSVGFAASRGRTLDINWYPASSYSDYVQDREHISRTPAPGEPVQVIGAGGQLWAYSADDHTVIREVTDGRWLEVRGQGMDKQAYLTLLDSLRLVGLDDFEAALPDEFVTTAERPARVQEIVDGIAGALGPARGLTPSGLPEPDFDTRGTDTYYLGVDIAGPIACGWLQSYVEASATGDTNAAADAVAALATARQWPVLQEMNAEGDYPEVVWEYADDLAAGRDPGNYQAGLGCP